MWSALLLLGWAIVYGLQLRKLPLGSVRNPGPGFFPLIMLCLFLVCLIYVIVQEGRKKRKKLANLSQSGKVLLRFWRTWIFLIITLLYVFLLNVLGYVLASILYGLVTASLFELSRHTFNWRNIFFLVAATSFVVGLVYVLFGVMFKIALP